jgi:hypothetical protein
MKEAEDRAECVFCFAPGTLRYFRFLSPASSFRPTAVTPVPLRTFDFET